MSTYEQRSQISIRTRCAVRPQALSNLPSSCWNVLFPQRGQVGSAGLSTWSVKGYGATLTTELPVVEFAQSCTAWVFELNLGPYMLLIPL